MLKSEMQHQFWITKKAVQRKLGSKEDEHIVSSDAGLDAKIALLKSISETCTNLNKILDQYQERLCILSQEECTFGRFLKEIGKRSKTTGASITNSGKAIYYSGQQRMTVRAPLLRLQHEVEVFNCRAVADTVATINCMEKERTEYRAALSWMKSMSAQLDPDNCKGLDKFRRAQSHVRMAKEGFDKLAMDCIQKIDLLAAARCNMFSHGLVTYMTALLQFSKKTSSTYKTVSSSLALNPQYSFCLLKDLSQGADAAESDIRKIQMEDNDQSMLFADDFKDKENDPEKGKQPSADAIDNILVELSQTMDEIDSSSNLMEGSLADMWKADNDISKYFSSKPNAGSCDLLLDAFKEIKQGESNSSNEASGKLNNVLDGSEKKAVTKWLDLFADLDPLENLQAFDMKFNGKSNTQQT